MNLTQTLKKMTFSGDERSSPKTYYVHKRGKSQLLNKTNQNILGALIGIVDTKEKHSRKLS